MEEKVAFYIRDTMEALQYLHNCRVAHLDIKVRREWCYHSVLSYREFPAAQRGRRCSLYPKAMITKWTSTIVQTYWPNKGLADLQHKVRQEMHLFPSWRACSQGLSGFNEGKGGCLRQEGDVTSTWLKGNSEINPREWFGLTPVPTQLPSSLSWFVPRQLRAGREDNVPPSHPLQCPGEPKTRGEERAGEGWQGQRRAALCCRAWAGNWVGNIRREGLRGRTSCTVDKKLRWCVMSHSTRSAQLVLPFVSAHGRRHRAVLDSAL